MSFRSAGVGFGGAIAGGVVVWIGQAGSFHLWPVDMSYADLAATLLAAVGVIVAIFGGVLALAAIWGFNQLKRDAISAAQAAGASEIREQIENGTIRDYIRDEIERLTDEEFKSERMDERINRRVDALTFGRPNDDKLLDDEGDEE
ncbi:MAG TPA: hypothetical protein VM659_01900 [Dongiaceae bacterium]|nr:hypothetical protein [Dongiaceae bacterium]